MWDIKYLIKDFIRAKNFQEFINNRFKNDHRIVINKNVIKSVETIYGGKFLVNDMFDTISDIEKDYHINDLKNTDIVLDIGACIGAFTLKVSRNVAHVYSVEPVFTERLNENIKLSDVKNVTIIDGALGDGILDIGSGKNSRRINAMSLNKIISLCGGRIDFLKVDCEGGEWYIKPEELKGIRRIEAEVHNFNEKNDFKKFLNIIEKAGFEYTFETPWRKLMIVHARNKSIK